MKQIKEFKTLRGANEWLSNLDRTNIYNIKIIPIVVDSFIIYIIIYEEIKPSVLNAKIDFMKLPKVSMGVL